MEDEKMKDFGTTVLRLGLGAVFLVHGLIKIFVFTIPGTMGFFESVGFPGFMAIPVIVAEVGGGLLLLLGIGTRWSALAMVPIMIGATTVHWGNGFAFSNANGGWEFTAFLAVVSLALFLQGDDGRLALSSVLGKRGPSPARESTRRRAA
jgi:putative oxidoreductase